MVLVITRFSLKEWRSPGRVGLNLQPSASSRNTFRKQTDTVRMTPSLTKVNLF